MSHRSRSVKTPPPSLRLYPKSRYVSPRGMNTPSSERFVVPYRPRRHTPKMEEVPQPIVRSKSPAPIHPTLNRQQATLSPIIRHGPITAEEALDKYSSLLTSYEQKEILDYKEIYYLGVHSKKVRSNKSPVSNYGFDLNTHHYRANCGDHIAYRYEIRSILGKGAFGQVLRCTDHKTKETVALKIIINTAQMKIQGAAEIKMLQFLNEEDPNGVSNIVRVLDAFSFRNHPCVVFEVLGQNLYEFSRSNFFKRAAVAQVRIIGRQILRALQFAHGRGIVHCDMKPENVLLLVGSNTKVKVIDFGSACYIGQKHFDYIQSRFYRAPEVMLGIPYGPPMDIWSFGCVIAELATGKPLFPGENECHQLQLQMQILGPIPNQVLRISKRRDVFFDSDGKIYPINGKRKKPGSVSLQKATGIVDENLLDLLKMCFEWDQNKRITALDALKHPFFAEDQKLPSQSKSPRLSSKQKPITNPEEKDTPRNENTNTNNKTKASTTFNERGNLKRISESSASTKSFKPSAKPIGNIKKNDDNKSLNNYNIDIPGVVKTKKPRTSSVDADKASNQVRSPPRTSKKNNSITTIITSKDLMVFHNSSITQKASTASPPPKTKNSTAVNRSGNIRKNGTTKFKGSSRRALNSSPRRKSPRY